MSSGILRTLRVANHEARADNGTTCHLVRIRYINAIAAQRNSSNHESQDTSVTLRAKKPTKFISNCDEICSELRRCCGRKHEHQLLLGGIAQSTATYSREFCKVMFVRLRRYEVEGDEAEGVEGC